MVEILPGGAGLRVESLGRDDVLRFKTGDWVEITSDSREFSGLPGEMRKVTVEDSNQTVTFSGALPAAEFPEGVTDAENHVRIIRWDQSGIVRRPDGSELINLDLTTDGLILLTAAEPELPVGIWHSSNAQRACRRLGPQRRLLVFCRAHRGRGH